jgi:transcription-repair coupling factor (superfamily II helicase)
VRFTPVELKDWQRVRLDRLYPRSLVKETVGTVLVPRPSTARVGGSQLRDVELLAWAAEVVDAVLLATPASAQSA